MKSIEFFGPPGSGKTYYQRKLKELLVDNNFVVYNYEKNFYLNYQRVQKINFLKKIKFFFKSMLIQNNQYFFRLINYYFDKFISFNKEQRKFINNRFTKNFIKNYFKIFDNNYKNAYLRKKLQKWIINELASKNLSNKIANKEMILLNSEGIYQRLIRLVLNCENKRVKKIIDKINFERFTSDFIIYVNTDLNKCLQNISNRNDIHLNKRDIKKFYEKSKFIYSYKKKKIFIIKNRRDFLKVLKKIINEN